MRIARGALAVVVVSICGFVYSSTTVLEPARALPAPSDFSHYYDAGQAILHHRSPYTDSDFLYPPLVAFLAAPLAAVDYVTARWIRFLFSQACFLAAALLLWRGIGRDISAFCAIGIVWIFGGAAAETFVLGQIGPVLVLLLVLEYTQEQESRGMAAGLGFALKLSSRSLACWLGPPAKPKIARGIPGGIHCFSIDSLGRAAVRFSWSQSPRRFEFRYGDAGTAELVGAFDDATFPRSSSSGKPSAAQLGVR